MSVIRTKFNKLLSIALLGAVGLSSPVSADKGDLLSVTNDGSRLRSLPSVKGAILQNLKQGDTLTELSRKGKWAQVSLGASGVSGWIFMSNIERSAKANASRKITAHGANSISGPILKLSDLGYKDGILFEGTAANHARKLYFQVPQEVNMRRGLLRLHYRYSPLLEKHSNMRIYINGIPRKLVRLGVDASGGWLDIPLDGTDLQKRFVQIEVRSALLLSNDRCLDERIGGAYLQILPDTTLQWQLDGEIASIRTFWQFLPAKVVVSLPKGALNAKLFRSTLELTQLLQRNGRQVSFVRLPEMGDIIVAPGNKIKDWIEDHYHKSVADRYKFSAVNKNLVLVTLSDKQFLAVSDAHDSNSMKFLSSDWRDLALADSYQVETGIKKTILSEKHYSLALQSMGMNTDVLEMTTQASWSATVNPSYLPPGHRLDKVRIQLIAAPSMTDKPVMFYSYLNGVLIKASRLENTGRSDEIVLSLPQHLLSRVNNLYFVARRPIEGNSNNCKGEPMQFPIQITPTSSVETVVDDTVPDNFSRLPSYLSAGYETYLPKKYLQQPEKVLGYLSTLTTDMDLPSQVGTVNFYTPDEKITPKAAFILFGKANIEFSKQSVKFDQGRINIMNQANEVLLAVDDLPKVSIAQVVKSGSVYGMWVLPPDPAQLTQVKDMHLSKDDVAFSDHNGVLMTLDSSQPGLSRVEYPDSAGWFELFGEYRFWYFAIGWILLTSLIVYLYRLSKSHRKN